VNTPAHAVVNLLILGRGNRPDTAAPIALGSLLPDLPMVLFYVYHKGLSGRPESEIWGERYFDEPWQALFDVFNSIPLVLTGLVIAWRLGAARWTAFFAGMGLHALFDLPLHHDDAHRHFFPFSDWRFASPISYWDPAHYGDVVALVEISAVAIGSVMLWRRYRQWPLRILCAALAFSYALHWVYVLAVWA
jgi:hypothetical protein